MKWEPEFKGYWSDKDRKIWESTDWKARDYKQLEVEGDTVEGILTFYSLVKEYNVLVRNKLPQLEKRGGDEHE